MIFADFEEKVYVIREISNKIYYVNWMYIYRTYTCLADNETKSQAYIDVHVIIVKKCNFFITI